MSLWTRVQARTSSLSFAAGDSHLPGGLWRFAERLSGRLKIVKLSADTLVHEMREPDGEVYYVLKNPRDWKFLRVTREERTFCDLLDGNRTIADCVETMIEKEKVFPFFFMGPLIDKLYAGGFLAGQTPPLFQSIRAALLGRNWRVRFQRLLHRTVTFRGIDRWIGWLYRGFARALFCPVALVLLHLVAAAGLAGFVAGIARGLDVWTFPHGFHVEIPLVFLLILAFALLHELGHAFAMKWRGLAVGSGGMDLTLLMPTRFFVNTSDVWLEERPAGRIAVSWVGILASLVSSALAVGLAAFFGKETLAGSVLVKAAAVNYVLAFLNLNPLFETDGYHILTDWLCSPTLARDAREFWRRRLPTLLGTRPSLTPQERVFLVYGGLSALWSGVAMGIGFWLLIVVARAFQRFWDASGVLLRGVLATLGAAASLVLLYNLIRLVELVVVRATFALARRGYFHDLRKLAVLLCACWAAFLSVPAILSPLGWILDSSARRESYILAVSMAGLLVGAHAVRRLLSHGWATETFRVILAAFSLGIVTFGSSLLVRQGWGRSPWLFRELLLATAVSLFAASSRWRREFARTAAPRWGTWFLDDLPTLIGIALVYPVSKVWQQASLWSLTVAIATSLLLALGLANSIQTLSRAWESRLSLPLGLFATGMASWFLGAFFATPDAGGGIPEMGIWALSAGSGLFASAVVLMRITFDRFVPEREPETGHLLRGDGEKLRRSFALLADQGIRMIRDCFGGAHARALVGEYNSFLIARHYGISIIDCAVHDEVPRGTSLSDLGKIYSDCVGAFTNLVVRLGGRRFADRLIKNVYDSLYWDERELATLYLFDGSRWDALDRLVAMRDPDPGAFLRKVPLFQGLGEAVLDGILQTSTLRSFRPGETVFWAGEEGLEMFVVRYGVFDVYDGKGKWLNSRSTYDVFGEWALIRGERRVASIRARSSGSCLSVHKKTFEQVLRPLFASGESFDHRVADLDVLRSMPLFRGVDPGLMSEVLRRCERRPFKKGMVLMRAGEIGREMFILLSGEVTVYKEDSTGERLGIAQRARGDHVGEIALVREVPRTATVEAIEDGEALVLTKDLFEEFFKKNEALGLLTSHRLAVMEHAFKERARV
ncbi:MAG: cyclic nucleotide-binding domain-containing protein [Planctomycetes bacterium]|nr:cyclic nucleotide-binding domain-containing protein [Planctomycetota bacterium]